MAEEYGPICEREEVLHRAYVVYTFVGKTMTVMNVIGSLSREEVETWKSLATDEGVDAALWRLFTAAKFR